MYCSVSPDLRYRLWTKIWGLEVCSPRLYDWIRKIIWNLTTSHAPSQLVATHARGSEHGCQQHVSKVRSPSVVHSIMTLIGLITIISGSKGRLMYIASKCILPCWFSDAYSLLFMHPLFHFASCLLSSPFFLLSSPSYTLYLGLCFFHIRSHHTSSLWQVLLKALPLFRPQFFSARATRGLSGWSMGRPLQHCVSSSIMCRSFRVWCCTLSTGTSHGVHSPSGILTFLWPWASWQKLKVVVKWKVLVRGRSWVVRLEAILVRMRSREKEKGRRNKDLKLSSFMSILRPSSVAYFCFFNSLVVVIRHSAPFNIKLCSLVWIRL